MINNTLRKNVIFSLLLHIYEVFSYSLDLDSMAEMVNGDTDSIMPLLRMTKSSKNLSNC